MALDYSLFLRDKFQEDFKEADRELGLNLPLQPELYEILTYIQNEPKFKKTSVLIQMKDCFNNLNNALAECIIFAENSPRKKNPPDTSRNSLANRIRTDYWHLVKTWLILRSIRLKMKSVTLDSKRESVDQEKKYPFVYYVTEKETDAKNKRNVNSLLYGIDESYHGLDEQANKIIDLLLRQNDKQVVCIVGMGGSGKTALARRIFLETRKIFRAVMWVDLTEFTDPNTDTVRTEHNMSMSTGLFFRYAKENLEKNTNEGIFSFLKKKDPEKNRKSMVVLDGVWHKTGEIEKLIQDPIFGRGDVIIVTSRLEGVLSDHQGSVYMHRMEHVSSENCWRIFENTIRRKQMTTSNGEIMSLEKTRFFSEMKDEIVEKCDGLPMAAKAIAEVISYGLGKREFWTDPKVRKTIMLRVTADAPIVFYLAHKHDLTREIGWYEKIINQNGGVLSVHTYMDPSQFVKELGPFYHTELISVRNYP